MFEQLSNLLHQYFMDFIVSVSVINVVELLIIAVVLYRIYKYITGTQAEQLLKGILMLFLALLLSKIFKLEILGRFLETVVNIVLFGLVVIFQPELRKFLGYLGQPGILSKNIFSFESEIEVKNTVSKVVDAIKHLSKSHTGALIVIKNTDGGFENYIEVGTKLDARISTEILLTIFHTNTPLHDGAVVIMGDRIAAAGVLLPLTEDPKLSWQYGTRHRAAIGMSEVSDAVCIVVSEETGKISVAQSGILTKYDNLEDLKAKLESLYGFSEKEIPQKTEKSKFIFNPVFIKDFSRFPNLLTKKEQK